MMRPANRIRQDVLGLHCRFVNQLIFSIIVLTLMLSIQCTIIKQQPASRQLLSVCPEGQYYDGIDESCVDCRMICQPHQPLDFCCNNCRELCTNSMQDVSINSQMSPVADTPSVTASVAHLSLSTPPPITSTLIISSSGGNQPSFHVIVAVTVCAGLVLVAAIFIVALWLIVRLQVNRNQARYSKPSLLLADNGPSSSSSVKAPSDNDNNHYNDCSVVNERAPRVGEYYRYSLSCSSTSDVETAKQPFTSLQYA